MQVYDSPNNIGPDKRQKRKSPARIPGYTSYEKRRLSFERKGWNQPNAPPPAKLAKAGFYCKGDIALYTYMYSVLPFPIL